MGQLLRKAKSKTLVSGVVFIFTRFVCSLTFLTPQIEFAAEEVNLQEV